MIGAPRHRVKRTVLSWSERGIGQFLQLDPPMILPVLCSFAFQLQPSFVSAGQSPATVYLVRGAKSTAEGPYDQSKAHPELKRK